MKIKQPYKIAENDAGFEFYVGTLGGRWIGFAISASDSGNRMLIVLDVSEGFILGMSEKREAIRRSLALIQEELDLCGVDRMFVADDLRPKFGEYVCPNCGILFCEDH